MKTYSIPCVLAVWALTTAVGYGQPDEHHAEQMGALDRTWEKYKAQVQKDVESGRNLFGADARWGSSSGGKRSPKEEFGGTLTGKDPPDFKIGDWGWISGTLRVVSRVSDTECLVTIKYYNKEGKIVDLRSETVIQTTSGVMLLRGLDMSKVTDGVEFVLQHPVTIENTYRYTTTTGSQKTVLVLECNSAKLKEIDAKLKADEAKLKAEEDAKRQAAIEQAKAEKERKEAIEESKYRTWTTADGTKVDAKYGWTIGSTITLTKRDGSKLKVPLAELSAADQKWIANRPK